MLLRPSSLLLREQIEIRQAIEEYNNPPIANDEATRVRNGMNYRSERGWTLARSTEAAGVSISKLYRY